VVLIFSARGSSERTDALCESSISKSVGAYPGSVGNFGALSSSGPGRAAPLIEGSTGVVVSDGSLDAIDRSTVDAGTAAESGSVRYDIVVAIELQRGGCNDTGRSGGRRRGWGRQGL
jgi:hypothetical protein